MFFCNCWHKPVARSHSVRGAVHPGTHDGTLFSCLWAGQTRGAWMSFGRKWCPTYHPYGRSRTAAVAELGKPSRAEVGDRCVWPGSSPSSPPPQPPSLLRKALATRSWSTGATGGLPFVAHRAQCPYITCLWLSPHTSLSPP